MEEQKDAPHSLNAFHGEDQNDAPHPSYAFGGEEQKGEQDNTVNLKNDRVTIITFPKNSKNVRKNQCFEKKKNSSTTTKAVQGNRSQSFIEAFHHGHVFDLADAESKDSEDNVEDKEEIAKIVAADAEGLAENFKKLQLEKKNKTTPNPPKRKRVFKKVPDPAYFFEPKEKPSTHFALTSEELKYQALKKIAIIRRGGPIDHEFFNHYPEVLNHPETNPWQFKEYDKEKKAYEEEKRRIAEERSKERKLAWQRAIDEKAIEQAAEEKKRPPIIPSECWDDDLFY